MHGTSASPDRLNAQQRSAHIREVVLAKGVELRERYPLLKHQDALGAGILAFAKELVVAHGGLLRVGQPHVLHIVVVVGNAAAQPRGLHQAPPQPAVRLVLPNGNQFSTHHRSAIWCGCSATYGVSLSVRCGLRRACTMVLIA